MNRTGIFSSICLLAAVMISSSCITVREKSGDQRVSQLSKESASTAAVKLSRSVDVPKLPRVLVIGDSISINYHEAAKAALHGVADYQRIEGNSFSTVFGVTNMAAWLGDYKAKGRQWDVIQFNHGLHDLKQAYDKTTDTWGNYAVSVNDYMRNLELEIKILKETGAKLIWCSTTPVPNSNKGQYARRKGAEEEFNRAAMEVMRRHPEIQINDLHEVVDSSPVFDNWRKGVDVHYYKEEEQKKLGEAVAAAVRKALGNSSGLPDPVNAAVDWPAFMRQHDMTFDRLPRRWQEAPHFGNAMLGSMLYGADDTIRLQIFRADVQDHRDDTWGWPAYSRPRLMIGHFSLHTAGKVTGCKWRKDLWNAELTGTITTEKGEIKIRHFVHAADMAIVTELTPTEGEKACNWTWHPAEAKTTRPGYPATQEEIEGFAKKYGSHYAKTLKPWQSNPAGRLEKDGGISVWIQDLLAGGQYATAWGEDVCGETRTLVASIANSYPASTAAKTSKSDVGRFLKVDKANWTKSHQDWWHDYYQKSFVAIPDKALESLYWQTIYRYGCTSRSGRCFVDTPGIWFQGGPWAYVTTDWNIQSAHWSVYAANRLEQGEEVVNRLYAGREELIKAVRPVEWQSDSAYLPIEVALDMIGNREQDMRYYDLVGLLPWTLNNAWSQYRFSMDDGMLRDRIYPLLRRAVNFYVHIAKEGDDGKLHLPPTYSPESGVWRDCNFDLALFKWSCMTLLKASKRLGIDDPMIPRWREVVARLTDFPAGEDGFKQGSDRPALKHHRHLSHLLMIYPLYLVNIEQEGSGDVLRKSILQAYDLKGADSLAAMVQTHAGPIATALGDGDLALKGLKAQQEDLLPNGLWACAGNPCIESTLSLANNIQDMLIQSWSDPAKDEPGAIRIFPAVPVEWKDVEFRDLRAEGAFLVSAKREGGLTQWVRIKSLAGEPCLVRTDIRGEIRAKGRRSFKVEKVSTGTCRIDLKKGEEVMLSPDDK